MSDLDPRGIAIEMLKTLTLSSSMAMYSQGYHYTIRGKAAIDGAHLEAKELGVKLSHKDEESIRIMMNQMALASHLPATPAPTEEPMLFNKAIKSFL